MAKQRGKYNNTAGRLLEIFEAAAKYTPIINPAYMAWQTALKLEVSPPIGLANDDYAKLLKRMLPLQVALRRIEDDIREQRPDQVHLWLRYFPDLWSAAVPRNLESPWGLVSPNLGDAQLDSLEHCANSLPQDAEIKQEELKEIAKAVDKLFTQVRKSKIDSHLKQWLLEMLAKVRQAIDEYWVRGPKAFRDAMVIMKGESDLHPKATAEVSEKDEGLFSGLCQLFARVVDVASKVNGALHLLEYAGPVSDNVPFLSIAVSAAAIGAVASQVTGGGTKKGEPEKK